MSKWNSNNIQGLYNTLSKEYDDADWGYVNNPRGGFWAMWFDFKEINYNNGTKYSIYLQFEVKPKEINEWRIAIKLKCENYNEMDNDILYESTNNIREVLKNEISKHSYFHLSRKTNAENMTIAYMQLIDKNFQSEKITAENIKERTKEIRGEYLKLIDRIRKNTMVIIY